MFPIFGLGAAVLIFLVAAAPLADPERLAGRRWVSEERLALRLTAGEWPSLAPSAVR